MTIGGSWIFCADDTMANAELVVTRTDRDGMERIDKFKGREAVVNLKRLLDLDDKTMKICGSYPGDECRGCPIGKAITTGYSCRGWIDTHVEEVLMIYEKWGKEHGTDNSTGEEEKGSSTGIENGADNS